MQKYFCNKRKKEIDEYICYVFLTESGGNSLKMPYRVYFFQVPFVVKLQAYPNKMYSAQYNALKKLT